MSEITSLITEKRLERLTQAAQRRSRFHTFVLEEVHKSHNMSAILRSLDGFGFQDVHVIHQRTTFLRNRGVTKGSDKWLDIHRHENVAECLQTIKARGYRIAVTDASGVSITEVDWSVPSAIVMGAELDGVGPELRSAADLSISVPMVGLVSSFNVSVATACIAFHLRKCLESRPSVQWKLTDAEQEKLLTQWIARNLTHKQS